MKEKTAKIGIIANVILAAIKIVAGLFSGSASIIAEGVHSFADAISSAIGYLGIKISSKPADADHPYGHFKYEVLSGVIITIILFATGVGIIIDAYHSWQNPGVVKLSILSFAVMLFSALTNEVMARYKINTGMKENSVALVSDGYHSRVDVYSSLVVFVGLFLNKYWVYSDAVLALLIGLYIIKESFSLGREAIDSLLDISAGPDIENLIKKAAFDLSIDLETVKTQKKGLAITANLEIILDSHISVDEANKISEQLRQKLLKDVERLVYVSIQIKSHNLESNYYQPAIGRSLGWQGQGRHKNVKSDGRELGPGGYCICPKCGYKIEHKKGVPCGSLKCPDCNINLEREQDA